MRWSPGDNRSYLQKKIALYLTHGSLVVLDVDPLKRIIQVHDDKSINELHESDEFMHPLVPWLMFPVGAVFRDPDVPKAK